MTAAARGGGGGAGAGGPDAAAAEGSTKLRKMTNLSTHLVTVPALPPTRDSARLPPLGLLPEGIGEETVKEIACGMLRCLKCRGGPPVNGVYLVLPPYSGGGGCNGGVELWGGDEEGGGETTTTAMATRAAAILSLLIMVFRKLERYNDMIGMPKLMSDACFEFMPISI